MLRRLLLLVLAAGLVAVTATSRTAGQSPKSGDKPPAVKAPQNPPITSSVYYRTKGTTDPLALYGIYKSQEAGKVVFKHLVSNGFEVELRISNVAVPKTPPRPSTAMLPAEETVDYSRAKAVFEQMAKQPDIAFRFPVDGCYARAHLMCQRMIKMGLKPYKVWSFANGEPLWAKTDNHPAKHVTWGYHVAPVLRVKMDNGKQQRWYVIDPSLSKEPWIIQRWEEAQMKDKDSHRPYVYVSRLGQPPKLLSGKPAPGTGYWPGTDPKEGPDTHAVKIMKQYKPLEGKALPPGFAWQGPEDFPARWLAVGEQEPALGLRRREVVGL